MTKKIVITSGKGGVGKTTTVANLGVNLALLGKRVCMIDADLGLNNLDMVLGIENLIVYDLNDCIEGRCRPKQALVQCRSCKNAYLLPSTHSFVKSQAKERFKELIDGLSTCFDYILIDCPAGIGEEFRRAIALADEAIVVTTPHLSALRDADKVIANLRSLKMEKTSVVVNRVRGDLVVSGRMISPEEIEQTLKCALIGVIPDDDFVFLCSAGEIPPEAQSYKAFRILASNIINGKKKIFAYGKEYLGFWGSIRRGLKKTL
ncbi:MAG: septum site-determining protein MinD [Clostridia bacterium]|nr:septum site-determining protein MinD [Clostridia bacterium]